MRPVLFALLLASSWPAKADDAEVAYLLSWVRASGCVFIRNNDTHTSPAAAEHLAMKYNRVRGRIDTADEFIARIATGSSISGKPYRVQCSGEPATTSSAWLTEALASHRLVQGGEAAH